MQVAKRIFETFHSVLMGLDSETQGPDGSCHRQILLYPKGRNVCMNDVGIVITRDLQVAHQISNYEVLLSNFDEELGQQSKFNPPMISHRPEIVGDKDDIRSSFQSDQEHWPRPPFSNIGRPHSRLIQLKDRDIAHNMMERSISEVTLNDRHILVCSEGGWPLHFFYFLMEMRKSGTTSPPIVILCPTQPSIEEWGLLGFFENVYYLQGSPMYEMDLIRGKIHQTGKVQSPFNNI